MIYYYPKVNFSLTEVRNKSVIIIHSLAGCMFHCYQCLNYVELISSAQGKKFIIDDIISIINQQEVLIDQIIISGGEFFVSSLSDIIRDLTLLKSSTSKPIIIYTTGYHYEKIKVIIDQKLVDGFHIDMKLPYHLLKESDTAIMNQVIGKTLSQRECETILKSIDYIIQHDTGYSQIRTITYPMLDGSAFRECQLYIDSVKLKYKQNTPYVINPFIYNDYDNQ